MVQLSDWSPTSLASYIVCVCWYNSGMHYLMHAHIHTDTHTVQTHTRTRTHTHTVQTHVHTHTHIYTHSTDTHTHTCTHTRTHTHIYTHTVQTHVVYLRTLAYMQRKSHFALVHQNGPRYVCRTYNYFSLIIMYIIIILYTDIQLSVPYQCMHSV